MKNLESAKKFIAIILTVCVVSLMALMFYFSSQNGFESHRLSMKVVEFIKNLNPLLVDLKKNSFLEYVNFDFVIRKIAHLMEYFSLTLLIYFVALGFRTSQKKARVLAIIFSILFSISDEVHQIFVNGRNPLMLDIFIDAAGTIGAMTFIFFIMKRRTHIKG